MKFRNMTLDKTISDAISTAENIFDFDGKMLGELLDRDDWKYGAGSGKEVFNKIVSCNKVANVYFYKPFNPFTRAVGYFDGKNIHINFRKFHSLNYPDLVGLLCHEWLHLAGFNHGTGRTANYKTGEKVKFSVPYFVSENIKRWL